jgi:hypothetical protein
MHRQWICPAASEPLGSAHMAEIAMADDGVASDGRIAKRTSWRCARNGPAAQFLLTPTFARPYVQRVNMRRLRYSVDDDEGSLLIPRS